MLRYPPPLTCKRFAWTRVKKTLWGPRMTMLLGEPCRLITEETRVRRGNRRLAVSCFGEAARHERPGEVYWFTRDPARDSRGPTPRRVAPGAGPYLGVCSCKFG